MTVPKYFKVPDGPQGRAGLPGDPGTTGSRADWRMYVMGDHPQAIPGEVYSDPELGHGWLAMADAYLSVIRGGAVKEGVVLEKGGTVTGGGVLVSVVFSAVEPPSPAFGTLWVGGGATRIWNGATWVAL